PNQGCGYRSYYPALICLAGRPGTAWATVRLRIRPVRRVHGDHGRERGALVQRSSKLGAEPQHHHAGRAGHGRASSPAASGVYRRAGGAVRLLHEWHDHGVEGAPRQESSSHRRSDQASAQRKSLPLRQPPARDSRGEARRRREGVRRTNMKAKISRREVLKGTGALVVSFNLFGPASKALAQLSAGPDLAGDLQATSLDSWIAIGRDGMVTVV